jgi:hypothetical protein
VGGCFFGGGGDLGGGGLGWRCFDCRSRFAYNTAPLTQNGLATSNQTTLLSHLRRGRKLLSLGLYPKAEKRLCGVFPDELDLLIAHLS